MIKEWKEWKQQLETELKTWIREWVKSWALEELQKDKYKGPQGEKGEKGVEQKDKVESRRILNITHPKNSNPLCIDLDMSYLRGSEEFQGAVELYGFKEPQRMVRWKIER